MEILDVDGVNILPIFRKTLGNFSYFPIEPGLSIKMYCEDTLLYFVEGSLAFFLVLQ